MSENAHLLTDLRLEVQQKDFRPVYRVMEEQRRGAAGKIRLMDLAVAKGRENLAQAVLMRLLTPRGDLSHLGHPDYGSRLHELVGRVNTGTSRNLARLFILESLKQEPRIGKVNEVAIAPCPHRPSSITVGLQVTPAASTESITIGPFTLELG